MFGDVLLGIIQGVCEFLPISSSSHMTVLGLDVNFTTIIFMHLSTVLVIFLFYFRDCMELIRGALDVLLLRRTPESRKALLVLTTFVPFAIVGFIVDMFYNVSNSKILMGISSITFGILLYVCNRSRSMTRKRVKSFKDALIIGLCQLISILPGASRLGCTISVMRIMGYPINESIRFSLLASIPVILSANIWYVAKIAFGIGNAQALHIDLTQVITSFSVATVFGLCALYLFDRLAKYDRTMALICLYRIVFGLSLIAGLL